MNGGGEGALPPWAAHYLPEFQQILRAIELSDGFVLFPIELPGVDVARALAHWLETRGHPVLVLQPDSRKGWETLAAALLGAEIAEAGVAMVIGPREVPEGMRWGLRLLNQRRDSTAKHLGRPLLWCGPKEFLDQTWQEAPDLWSIASVPRRLEGKVVGAAGPVRVDPVWTGGEAAGSSEQLQELYEAAKQQGDVRNAARIGLQLAEILGDRSEFPMAHGIATEVCSLLAKIETPDLSAQAHLMLGRVAAALNDFKEAEAELTAAQGIGHSVGDPQIEAMTLRTLATVYLRTNRLKEAEIACQQALPVFIAMGDRLGEATTLQALADLYLKTDRFEEAEAAYHQTLLNFIALDHHRGRANTLVGLGDLYVRAARLNEAEVAYQQALAIRIEFHDRRGQASMLVSLGQVALAHGVLVRAFQYELEALALFRELDQPHGMAAADFWLGRAALAAGKPLRSAVLLRGAMSVLMNLEDHVGLVLTFSCLARALRELKREEQASAADILAWVHASTIGHPLARHIADQTGLPEPPPEAVIAAREALADALAACEAELEALGEDPYAPLDAPRAA